MLTIEQLARRESFTAVPETCPIVDQTAEELEEQLGIGLSQAVLTVKDADGNFLVNKLIGQMVCTIKDNCTFPFRKALTAAIQERFIVEEQRDEAMQTTTRLTALLEECKEELAEVREALDTAITERNEAREREGMACM